MTQQVNLYQPIFRKQKRKFSAMAILQATAAMVLGIVALYGYTWWQVHELRNEAKHTDKQLATMTARLDDVTKQFGALLTSKPLQEQVAGLERRVAEKQKLQQALQGATLTNTQGFSDYFVAFARQHIPGLWLTSFSIVGATEQLTLQGRSMDPEIVPRYIQQLSAERRLGGIEFQSFQMSRPAPDPKAGPVPYVEFLVKTESAKSPSRATP